MPHSQSPGLELDVSQLLLSQPGRFPKNESSQTFGVSGYFYTHKILRISKSFYLCKLCVSIFTVLEIKTETFKRLNYLKIIIIKSLYININIFYRKLIMF